MESTARSTAKGSRTGQRVMMVTGLETLVGGHPEALRDMYAAGEPADATRLGGERRGCLLAIEPLQSAFVLTRPVVRALSRLRLVAGKSFESGGTAGRDRLLGGERFRFRCEVGPSILDDQPTLLLRYDDLDNPWPIAACAAELRRVAGVGIGLTAWSPQRRARVLFWWGIDLGA